MHLKLQILIYLQVVLNEVYLQTLEDKSCVLSNGNQGKCVNILNCLKIMNEYTEACNKSGNNITVCCETFNKTIVIHEHHDVYAIVGGRQSIPDEFPHMAALGFGNKNNIEWKCGGSLISNRFVLTAAHCLKDQNGEVKFVRMGDVRLDGNSKNRQDFEIIRRIPHPDYKPPLVYNDIALIELDRTPNYTISVKPACLHTNPIIVDKYLQATGWGLTENGGNQSFLLQKVHLDVFSHSDCNAFYKTTSKRRLPDGILDDRQICAGGRVKIVDTCQGDSGGPLHIYRFVEKLYHIMGVTSFGKACGSSPSVYNRVSHYVPWIQSFVPNEILLQNCVTNIRTS